MPSLPWYRQTSSRRHLDRANAGRVNVSSYIVNASLGGISALRTALVWTAATFVRIQRRLQELEIQGLGFLRFRGQVHVGVSDPGARKSTANVIKPRPRVLIDVIVLGVGTQKQIG